MSVFYTVFAMAVIMIVFERIMPGRNWQKVPTWLPRAIILNGFQVCSAYIGIYTWDHWFHGFHIWDLSELGIIPGAVIGYLVITFIYYWWHRARHQIPLLWRWFHQVHHSPQRIEIITSFYKNPVEIIVNGMLSSFILYSLVGLSPASAALAVTFTGVAELFYHWNIQTPHWLGYIIQRPESHCIHHQRGLHKNNYSDLPIWDMIFGTFHNPISFNKQCGFKNNEELRLVDMLMGKDITKE